MDRGSGCLPQITASALRGVGEYKTELHALEGIGLSHIEPQRPVCPAFGGIPPICHIFDNLRLGFCLAAAGCHRKSG